VNQPQFFPRWRWLILAVWVLVALAALPFAARVNQELDAGVRLKGSESLRVEATLQQQFESPIAKIALLRIAAAPDPRTAEGKALLRQVSDQIRSTAGVRGVLSYLDRGDSLFLGDDGSPILIVGLNAPKGAEDALMTRLGQSTEALHARLEGKYPGISFGWTGEAAVNADLRRISADETRAAEWRVLPLTLVLLLIAFRSLISAILPVLCGALTVVVALGVVAAVNRVWPASLIVVSIVSMVGLGLSIDYALLIVSRYRDGIEEGLSRPEAVIQAARHGGRTVLVSGTAVAIGFAAMLMVRVSEIRSIGMAGRDHGRGAGREHAPADPAYLDRSVDRHRFGRARAHACDPSPLAALGILGHASPLGRTGGRRHTASASGGSGNASAHRSAAWPVATRYRSIGAGAA